MFIKPMVENAVRGMPTHFATGGPMKRDYTYVFDCASAVVRAIEMPSIREGTQRVLNVAAGAARTAADVAQAVRRLIPDAQIEIGDTLSPLEEINAKMRASLDIAAAKDILGWAPQWPLDDGIRDYAERFRAYALATAN
jgi:UDP-glucose 4-epimerase